MRLPPLWFRRLVIAPVVVIGAVLLVWTLPLLLVLVSLTGSLPLLGRLPRALWFLVVLLVWEAAALMVLFGTWIASGFGWRIHTPAFRDMHYRLISRFLRILFRQIHWALRVEIHVIGEPAGEPGEAPVIVASRHAGPGDSFILVHVLLNELHRRPRIVMKDILQWDPVLDVVSHRVPTVIIAPSPVKAGGARTRGAKPAERIGEMSADMGDKDALLVFPEGGKFTLKRRASRIQQLIDDGHEALAGRAAGMRHVMAPRPGGIFAAIDASPDAGVLFVAHTGLAELITVKGLWQSLSQGTTIVINTWYVRPEQIPGTFEERIEWLYDWWERIDEWIEVNGIDPQTFAGPPRQ